MSEQNPLTGNGNGGDGHGRADPLDTVLGFHVLARNARGRVVRLGPVLNAILSAHAYPEPLANLLAEALVLTALLGATLREDEGQITLQAQSQGGPVDLLVCDYRAGAIRGYLRVDPERVQEVKPGQRLEAIFGKGYLAITLDQTLSEERYQGIVPLEGETLSDAAEHYFQTSEQLPTLIRVAALNRGSEGWTAGGLLIQHLPRGEEGGPRLFVEDGHPDWQHVKALATTTRNEELTDPDLPLEALLWRLFHEEETRVTPAVNLSRGCRCSPAHIRSVISRFPEDDLGHMREPDGHIRVDCAFCARTFTIDL